MLRCLRSSAARDQNGLVFAITVRRPHQMKVGAAPLRFLPAPLIVLQVIDGRRIWITIVEVADGFGDIRRLRHILSLMNHGDEHSYATDPCQFGFLLENSTNPSPSPLIGDAQNRQPFLSRVPYRPTRRQVVLLQQIPTRRSRRSQRSSKSIPGG